MRRSAHGTNQRTTRECAGVTKAGARAKSRAPNLVLPKRPVGIFLSFLVLFLHKVGAWHIALLEHSQRKKAIQHEYAQSELKKAENGNEVPSNWCCGDANGIIANSLGPRISSRYIYSIEQQLCGCGKRAVIRESVMDGVSDAHLQLALQLV